MLTIPKNIKDFSQSLVFVFFLITIYAMYKNTQTITMNKYNQTHNNMYLFISLVLFIVAVLFKIV